ncbi:zinc-binding alcohol dehydrogenase family protein [soil metagenome]
MRAVVCLEPGKLALADRPLPAAREGWIAIDINSVGVCGTDFHIFEGTHPYLQYPRVMGHELSAVVAAGSGNARLPPGTRVVVNPYLYCGTCIACRKGRFNCCMVLQCLGVHVDGGMCERIVMPEGNLYAAGNLGLRDAAMVEFLAIGAHAVRRSRTGRGERALVVGMGPIGIGTAIFARAAGADVTIMDLSENRLDWCRDRLGFAGRILGGKDARAEDGRRTGGEFYDVVFKATGSARAVEASLYLVAHTGTLMLVGVLNADLTFADAELHKREISILASRNALHADFDQVVASILDGTVPTSELNTHTARLSDLPEAMPAWLAAKELPVKAILTI